MGGVFCRICRQTVFQVCVVSTDGDSAAGFVEPYLGQLFFFLIPVIILNFTSFRVVFLKGSFLPKKVPFKTGRIQGFSNGNAADNAEIVWRSHKKKFAKNYGLDRQTTSSQIGEITGVKRNCFLKNLRIVCRFLRMSFFYSCPGISPQRCLAHSLPEKSSQGHIPFGRSFSFQFAPQ